MDHNAYVALDRSQMSQLELQLDMSFISINVFASQQQTLHTTHISDSSSAPFLAQVTNKKTLRCGAGDQVNLFRNISHGLPHRCMICSGHTRGATVA